MKSYEIPVNPMQSYEILRNVVKSHETLWGLGHWAANRTVGAHKVREQYARDTRAAHTAESMQIL